jgi:hypothetical protein
MAPPSASCAAAFSTAAQSLDIETGQHPDKYQVGVPRSNLNFN